MTTFEPCQQTLFDETECGPSMSSPAAFPAKTYHMLASELALKVHDLVCGRSSPDLLARFDPGSRSWKTSQASLVPGMDEFSQTWPRSGMTLSGTAYPLPPSAPLTGGTGSGLWPTATAQNAKHGSLSPAEADRVNTGKAGLHAVVQMWPTPTANQYESQDMDRLLERRERVKAEKKNGNGFGLTLSQKVMLQERKMWPTPQAGDAKACMTGTQNQFMLPHAVKMWPTPLASQWKGTGTVGSKSHLHRLKRGYLDAMVAMYPTPRAQSARGSGPSRVGNKADLQTIVGGSLNPDWVEWLMGFPIGWTRVDGWKSRKASPASRRASKTAPQG